MVRTMPKVRPQVERDHTDADRGPERRFHLRQETEVAIGSPGGRGGGQRGEGENRQDRVNPCQAQVTNRVFEPARHLKERIPGFPQPESREPRERENWLPALQQRIEHGDGHLPSAGRASTRLS